MKKIIAILISLFFVASTFSVASIMAFRCPDCCDLEDFDISATSVKVGETFTVYYFTWGCTPTLLNPEDGLIEKIRVDLYRNGQFLESYDPKIQMPPSCPDCWFKETYRAAKPGKVVFNVPNRVDCAQQVEVTIKSRALPMDKFMKFFGLGKKD